MGEGLGRDLDSRLDSATYGLALGSDAIAEGIWRVELPQLSRMRVRPELEQVVGAAAAGS